MLVDITDLKIKKLKFNRGFQPVKRERAKVIYDSEYVEIDEVNKLEDANYTITSKVKGSYRNLYYAQIKISYEAITSCKCTCPDYADGNICKHIIATSMEIINPHKPNTSEKIEELEIERQREIENAILEKKKRQQLQAQKEEYVRKYIKGLSAISTYKGEYLKHWHEYYDDFDKEEASLFKEIDVDKIYTEVKYALANETNSKVELDSEIMIIPKLSISNKYPDVTFKIGKTTMYSVKNISALANAFKNSELLKFGKKLNFIAKEDNILESDRPILNFIINYSKIYDFEQNYFSYNNGYYRQDSLPNKSIPLFGQDLDNFFEIMKDKKICLDDDRVFTISDKKLDVKFVLEKIDKDLSIKCNFSNLTYITSEKNIYIFLGNKIYVLERTDALIIALKIFANTDATLIPENKINEFSMYILPKIKEYVEKDDILQLNTPALMQSNNLKIKMFIDLDEKNNIVLRIKFCYDEYEFNILDSSYKEYVKDNNIFRNTDEEKNILERVFKDGFEIKNDSFILNNEDYIYDFLYEKIFDYMKDFEVLATDKIKNRKIKKVNIPSVAVKIDSGMLNIDLSAINIPMDEIKDVLKSYSVKKKYFKLKSGDILTLENSDNLPFLEDLSNVLDVNYSKIDNNQIKLPMNRSLYLEKLLEKNKNIIVDKTKDFNTLIDKIYSKEVPTNIDLTPELSSVLRDYQKTGYTWLQSLSSYNMGGILADDMGLGKTLQIISLISSSLKNEDNKPSIVVCPSSLLLNWKAEIEKWCKGIKTLVIKGNAEERKDLINSYSNYNLLITSYDLLKRDILEYEGKVFGFVIADEAQYIKNFGTQNAMALKSLVGDTRFALTGTPIENSISELWSIFDFIMPGYLYSYNRFKKKFEEPILKDNSEETMKKLKIMINPFILRRVKKDVLTELPNKTITVLKNEMTEEQNKLYLSYLVQTKQDLAKELEGSNFEKNKLKILMLLTRLRQICCHPSLFIDNYTGDSGKLIQCLDIINEATNSGHKILLFSSYTSMFEILEKHLNSAKIKYLKLTGSTPVSSRLEMVNSFNTDDEIKIFLISLKAGGTGLNLTSADVVIHYDPWWNLSSENQATDRAYRIGQKNNVQVYKLITANSIEEKINALQEKKAEISEKLLSSESQLINKLSKEEILALFDE